MSPRNTRTGGVLERMVIPALQNGGYQHLEQMSVGNRIGGGRHVVDVIAEKDNKKYLISLKWQQVGGTAEQKVPFEVICLMQTIKDNKPKFERSYLVLGGDGWSLRDFYTGNGLSEYLSYSGLVEILTLEQFVAKANQGRL